LLRESDYLVIQAPLTAETRGLFDEPVLRRMKRGAILVNTARGPIVKDDALYRVLKEGWLSGAGLDDLEEEPAKRANWQPTHPCSVWTTSSSRRMPRTTRSSRSQPCVGSHPRRSFGFYEGKPRAPR
jgi:phosphoglycerate dehydrogenase-like enzyme